MHTESERGAVEEGGRERGRLRRWVLVNARWLQREMRDFDIGRVRLTETSMDKER